MMKNSKKQDDPARFSWADIVAFCLALYRLLLPQLIVTFLVVAIVMYLIFFVWF